MPMPMTSHGEAPSGQSSYPHYNPAASVPYYSAYNAEIAGQGYGSANQLWDGSTQAWVNEHASMQPEPDACNNYNAHQHTTEQWQ